MYKYIFIHKYIQIYINTCIIVITVYIYMHAYIICSQNDRKCTHPVIANSPMASW